LGAPTDPPATVASTAVVDATPTLLAPEEPVMLSTASSIVDLWGGTPTLATATVVLDRCPEGEARILGLDANGKFLHATDNADAAVTPHR
jgi:hypothetical protein